MKYLPLDLGNKDAAMTPLNSYLKTERTDFARNVKGQ